MADRKKSSRREFLKGEAALRALGDLGADIDAASATLPPLQQQRDASYLIQISRRAMACEFQVYLNAGQHPGGEEAALAALDVVDQLEDQLSVYRDESELSRLNRAAHHAPVAVEAGLFALLESAVKLNEATGGAFDITAGPLSKTWGFFRRQGRFPHRDEINSALERIGSRWLQLDRAARTVQFGKPGLEINLGAIGKGFALDRAIELLGDRGVGDCLIHGGLSSVAARGARTGAEAGWTVALRHPLRQQQRLAEVRLVDRALGTSGAGNQFFHHQGRRYGHVLDPRTGWPAEGVLSATVLAPAAAEADALATALFVLGRDGAEQFCGQRPDVGVLLACEGSRAGSIELVALNLDESDWRPLPAS